MDLIEIGVVIEGRQQEALLFLMRLMYSGRDPAWIYPWQDQAFAHFGFVPKRTCTTTSRRRSAG